MYPIIGTNNNITMVSEKDQLVRLVARLAFLNEFFLSI